MRYNQFRDFVFQLINQYSIRGDPTNEMTNDYADLSARIPNLLTMAMIRISNDGRPILGELDLDELEAEGRLKDLRSGYTEITPPDDFDRMTGDGIPVLYGGRLYRIKAYHMVGNKVIMKTKIMRNAVSLEYVIKPKQYGMITEDIMCDLELDGDEEQQMVAAFYVAAMLVMDEDSFVYANLMNEFEARLAAMKSKLSAEEFFISDTMGTEFLYM